MSGYRLSVFDFSVAEWLNVKIQRTRPHFIRYDLLKSGVYIPIYILVGCEAHSPFTKGRFGDVVLLTERLNFHTGAFKLIKDLEPIGL